jgi:hypothetical protein
LLQSPVHGIALSGLSNAEEAKAKDDHSYKKGSREAHSRGIPS